MVKRRNCLKGWIWYVASGFFLPWVCFLAASLCYRRYREIVDFPSRLFGDGFHYFYIACFDSIPFAVIAVIALVGSRFFEKSAPSWDFAISSAATAAFLLSLLYQAGAWSNLMGDHPDALTGVAFVLFPRVVTLLAILVGFIAWAVSVSWRWLKKSPETSQTDFMRRD